MTQTGWLIEEEHDGRVEWLYVSGRDTLDWTTNSVEALRFARKEDAEAFILYLNPYTYTISAKATEHMWSDEDDIESELQELIDKLEERKDKK